jgi:DOPA 4,5-dioxygenase
MSSPKRPVNHYKHYHAHVYFDAETIEFARHLCTKASENFAVQMGRVHIKPVGPHTMWSCQLLFNHKDFDALIPWLDDNRDDLSVFVHPLTGDDLFDHTELATWLGEEVELDLTGL